MGMQKLPLGNGSAKLVTFKYPNGGYTPGDTWDLYVAPDNLFKQMVYHRGSPKSPVPALVTVTWAGYKKVGPLTFSTEHRGTADGKPLHLFFTNVAVRLGGQTRGSTRNRKRRPVSMANWSLSERRSSKEKFDDKPRLSQILVRRGRIRADARERRFVKRQSTNAIRTSACKGARGRFHLSHRNYRNRSEGPSCRGLDSVAARRPIPAGERS